MLPTELLMFRVNAGLVQPRRVKATPGNLALVAALTGVFESNLGNKRFQLEDDLKALEVGRSDYRMVRGLAPSLASGGGACANGWSDHWQLGRIDGHAIVTGDPSVLLGGADGIAHLGALNGQPDVATVVASARTWFPLHSGGINDSLCWVEVSVYPLLAGDADDDGIAVPGLDVTHQLAVRQALLGARDFDNCAPGRWRTTVRFGQQRFQGNSYQLALVMADRLARGRDYLARGRIIATGASGAWHAGLVETVEGLAPKCALIAQQALPGDRVLLPQAWQAALPDGFADAVRARGASLACVAQIGMF